MPTGTAHSQRWATRRALGQRDAVDRRRVQGEVGAGQGDPGDEDQHEGARDDGVPAEVGDQGLGPRAEQRVAGGEQAPNRASATSENPTVRRIGQSFDTLARGGDGAAQQGQPAQRRTAARRRRSAAPTAGCGPGWCRPRRRRRRRARPAPRRHRRRGSSRSWRAARPARRRRSSTGCGGGAATTHMSRPAASMVRQTARPTLRSGQVRAAQAPMPRAASTVSGWTGTPCSGQRPSSARRRRAGPGGAGCQRRTTPVAAVVGVRGRGGAAGGRGLVVGVVGAGTVLSSGGGWADRRGRAGAGRRAGARRWSRTGSAAR